MDRYTQVSLKIPDEVFKEFALRIPSDERNDFIRDAIIEKLGRIPKPDKILELEKRIKSLEANLSEMKQSLTELEALTFERGKFNPHEFCADETDHKIVDYLIDHKGATTPELADYLETNRWHILNRLKKIRKRSKAQLGKSIIEYYGAERLGKKKAWWLRQEIAQT